MKLKKVFFIVIAITIIPLLLFAKDLYKLCGYSVLTVTKIQTNDLIQRDLDSRFLKINISGFVGLKSKQIEYICAEKADCLNSWKTLDSSVNWIAYNGIIDATVGRNILWISSKSENFKPPLVHEPIVFDIGEIFIVAGQSNACGYDKKFYASKEGKVKYGFYGNRNIVWKECIDPYKENWGGAVWPQLGDSLSKKMNAPIGFINLAKPGSNIGQWIKDSNYLNEVIDCIKMLGKNKCRAILWHQGESDQNTSPDLYRTTLKESIDYCNKKIGAQIPWLVSCASYHNGWFSEKIAVSQRSLWDERIVYPGPNSDSLGNEFRYDRTHFNEKGTHELAKMWQKCIENAFLKTNNYK